MRILHLSTRLILGGSQENTVLSCEGQARRGHEVHLAFGPIYGPEGSLLKRVQAFRGPGVITTHVVPDLVRQINPWNDIRAYSQLKRLIRRIKPDIVHTHSSKAGILGRAAAWAVGQSATGPQGHRATSEASPGDAPGRMAIVHTVHGPPFHKYLPRHTNALYVAAERFAAKRCHAIVSVADAMTEQFLARGIGRADQYTTVYSGMETSPFLDEAPGESRAEVRRTLGLTGTDFVIGTVARLAELKGHDDLLAALADALRTNPTWRLLWIGDGWWRTRLLERARTRGVTIREVDKGAPKRPAQLVLTGLVPPERIPGLIRAMDVLVHPSYREGLPRTVPQALLCAVPVIATDIDGTGEVCRDGQTGRLVPVGDRAALRAAVQWMYSHPAERAQMALRGREECRERFSAEHMVDELEKVYARARGGA